MPDHLIRIILAQRKDLSQDMVMRLIERKKTESAGFLSDEGAAMLVAQDLNVEMEKGEPEGIQIKDIVSGLGNVTIRGQVTEVSAIQEFKRQNGSSGKVLRFVMIDQTGEVRCVAWDKQAEELADQQIQGRSVIISHGYTREGLEGNVELHIGDRGEVQVTQGTREAYEQSVSPAISISDALKREGVVDIVGIVKTPPRVIEFKKANQLGKVLRTKVIDQTGRITLVAWNEKADDLRNVTVGEVVQVSGGRIKPSIGGSPEIHIDSMSRAEVLEHCPTHLADFHPEPIKISQIKANMRDVDVLAKILKIQPPSSVKRTSGDVTQVMRILLVDDTGIIQASLWDDKTELNLKEGEIILIEDATSRERLGEISISVGKSGGVSANPKLGTGSFEPPQKKIKELPSSGSFIVEGRIIGLPTVRQVQTSRGDTVDIAEFRFRDSSGECKVVFWRDLAKQIAELKQDTKIRLFSVHPRLGFKGGVELSSGPMTYLETISEPPSEIKPSAKVDKIIELKEGVKGTVQAMILELSSNSHALPICRKCGTEIEFKDDKAICESCGSGQDIDLSATLFLRIDDGSGFIDSIVESPEANALLAQDAKWILRSIVEKKTPRIRLTVETLSRLIGMRILAEGLLIKDLKTGGNIFQIEKIHEMTA